MCFLFFQMKRVVSHTKACKRKTNGGCPICKQLIALCCYHAKLCQVNRFIFYLSHSRLFSVAKIDNLGTKSFNPDQMRIDNLMPD
jgi:hypothetical protein